VKIVRCQRGRQFDSQNDGLTEGCTWADWSGGVGIAGWRWIGLWHEVWDSWSAASQCARSLQRCTRSSCAASLETVQESEMASNLYFTISTGVTVHFRDSHSTVAARFKREQQWTASSISTQSHRRVEALRQRPQRNSSQSQRTSAKDPRLYDARGETCRVRFADPLKPPSKQFGLANQNQSSSQFVEFWPFGDVKVQHVTE
jgi:hypothetical protein